MQAILSGRQPSGADHADLWKLIDTLLTERGGRNLLRVEKAKAHLTKKEMESGKVDKLAWALNDKVDAAAKRAGKVHSVPEHIVKDLQRRIGATVLVQKMYVEILMQRHEDLERLQKRFPVGDEEVAAEYEKYLCGELDLQDADPLRTESEEQLAYGEEEEAKRAKETVT